MRRFISVMILLASPCTYGFASEESPRKMSQPIVNGVLTSSLPSVGLLLVEGAEGGIGSCTGTLIGCRTVLTAAHCFCGTETPASLCQPSDISAVWFQHAGPFLVSDVQIHPDYVFGDTSDLAIVRLSAPVSGISPTPINTVSRPPIGTPGVVAGFGRTGGVAEDSGVKRAGLVSTSACQIANPANHVCWNFLPPLAAAGEDSSTCQGDSGGPLFIDPGSGIVLGGVTSGGLGDCLAPNNPWDADVFVDRAWIQQNGAPDLNNTTCGSLPQAGAPQAPIQFAEGTLGPGNVEDTWEFEVPTGTGLIRATVNGEDPLGPIFGGNDFDLRIRHNAPPTVSQFDCLSDGSGAVEFCELVGPTAGSWFATVNRLAGLGQYQLTVTTFQAQSTGPCVQDTDTLCLLDNRFRVEVDWRTPQGGEGKGNAKKLTTDTGYFWFFEENNVEMVIKVLNACSFADRFWVFAGGLTNVEVNIRVTDTEKGITVPFRNPQGAPFQPIQNTSAFATCP